MKPHDYRIQIRDYTEAPCSHCGQLSRVYGSPLWEEPISRVLGWPVPDRFASAHDEMTREEADGRPRYQGHLALGVAPVLGGTFIEEYRIASYTRLALESGAK